MTAIICVAQPKHGCVHVVTDAAAYMQDHGIVAFMNKSAPVAQWPGAIASTGSMFNITLFRSGLAEKFTTWDDMIAGSAAEFPKMVKDYGLSFSIVVLAGISKERGPEAYQFTNRGELPDHVSDEEAHEFYADAFTLVRLPDVIMTPVPGPEMAMAADYAGIDPDADPDEVVWGMRKVLSIQRTMPLPDTVSGIGGFAELTTISTHGISQRIIERWPEDKIGGKIRPPPIDWKQWHRDNPKPGAVRQKLRLVP